ncbi:hypothetical protein TKK_0014590 [Trichogramma kaykai]
MDPLIGSDKIMAIQPIDIADMQYDKGLEYNEIQFPNFSNIDRVYISSDGDDSLNSITAVENKNISKDDSSTSVSDPEQQKRKKYSTEELTKKD